MIDAGSDLNKAGFLIYNTVVNARTALISLFSTSITKLAAKDADLGDLGGAIVAVWSGQVWHERITPGLLEEMLSLDRRLDRGTAAILRISNGRRVDICM